MKSKELLVVSVFAIAAQTGLPQTNLLRDDFDILSGWTQGLKGGFSLKEQQLVLSGQFGPTHTNDVTETYAFVRKAFPFPGALPNLQTLEARVDLVGASQTGVCAHLQFLWLEDVNTHSYTLSIDPAGAAVFKSWNLGGGVAYLFATNQPIKSQNVTLAFSMTRVGSDLRMNGRVLDKSAADAVLFECSVTDTPQSDAVAPADQLRGMMGNADPAGNAWPIDKAPPEVVLGMYWLNTTNGTAGVATATFDNVRVNRYAEPTLAIQNAILTSWPAACQFGLESAPTPQGPWSEYKPGWARVRDGTYEVATPAGEAGRYFRLK